MDSAFAQKTGRIAAASSPPGFFSFDFFTKITVNPNPSPFDKRFGFLLFGRRYRARTCDPLPVGR